MIRPVINVGDRSLSWSSQGTRFAVATGEIGKAPGLKGLGAIATQNHDHVDIAEIKVRLDRIGKRLELVD